MKDRKAKLTIAATVVICVGVSAFMLKHTIADITKAVPILDKTVTHVECARGKEILHTTRYYSDGSFRYDIKFNGESPYVPCKVKD